MTRKPFFKNLNSIPIEDAHGGNGSRQLLLSPQDPVSQHFQAMTKGFLPPDGIWDWHKHDDIDEYFLVLSGSGEIIFEDGTKYNYKEKDLIYIPANTPHRIENTGNSIGEFYFVRLNA